MGIIENYISIIILNNTIARALEHMYSQLHAHGMQYSLGILANMYISGTGTKANFFNQISAYSLCIQIPI